MTLFRKHNKTHNEIDVNVQSTDNITLILHQVLKIKEDIGEIKSQIKTLFIEVSKLKRSK